MPAVNTIRTQERLMGITIRKDSISSAAALQAVTAAVAHGQFQGRGGGRRRG